MLYSPWPHWIRWRTSHNQKLQYLSNSKTTRNSCCINLGLTGLDGVQLHLSVKVFTAKVLIVDTIFTSPAGDGTAMLRGHPSHAKVQPLEVQRDYLRFSVVFKGPWVMFHNRESNPRPPALQLCALPIELTRLFSLRHRNTPLQHWWVPAAWCYQIKHYTVVLSHPSRARSYQEKLSRKRRSPFSWVNGKNSWPFCPSQLYSHMLRLSRLDQVDPAGRVKVFICRNIGSARTVTLPS